MPLFALVVYVYAVEVERHNWSLVFAGLAFWGMDWFNTFGKRLPADKRLKILGIPNRLVLAVAGSIFCVFVEVLLNLAGALTWDCAFWGRRAPWLIFLIGYLPFFLVSFWVYDMESIRKKLMAVRIRP